MEMSDILYYFSGSADKLPGSGVNEYISDRSRYSTLASISDWRRVLSNFHISEFVYRDRRYKTVEHAFQGMKICTVNDNLGYTFCMDSQSILSMGGGDAARRARKIAIMNSTQIQSWNRSKDDIMRDILMAKFVSDMGAARTLIATLNAELWHGAPRVAKERQYSLESVRSSIRKDPNILAYLLTNGDVTLIDQLIDRGNILAVMSRVDRLSLSDRSILWMRDRDLHPEWFIELRDIPSNLWSKYLANAINAQNISLVSSLIDLYRDRIQTEHISKMILLAKDNQELISIIYGK